MMETPTSDFGSSDDLTPSDDSSTHVPHEPFEPKFKVKVTEPVKDGENVTYTVKCSEFITEKDFISLRDYEDFEYLHHSLVSHSSSNGVIMPPLPHKAVIDAKDTSSKSKKQLGNKSNIVIGDEFQKDCRALEMYLKLLITHRILGRSSILDRFLTEKQAPERVQVRKSFFGKLSTIVDGARKAHHRDIDEFFQNERDWCENHCKSTKELCDSFNKVLYAEQRLSVALAHLSTALLLGGGIEDELAVQTNKLLVRFSESLEDAKHGSDVDVANDENSLGYHLDHSHRYATSLKDMLFQRTCLMLDYEESNRTLEKAKSNKHSEAEEHKLSAERSFEDCSDIARKEIQLYKQQRVVATQDALVHYADAKIKTARDTYALLARSLSYFKQLDVGDL